MCNLFDSSKNTQEQQQSSQTGQSNTQGNLWPQLGDFFNQYLGNASSANVPINGFQTGAAEGQTGVAGSLAPAQGVANSVATNGITPQSIQSFMSPYIANVVNPTLQAQQIQNQQAISSLRGNQAARGALGNNTGSEAAYYAGVQPAQQAQIASLYNTGYGQATGTAAQSAGLQLQGAGTAGSLAGAQTGANATLGNLGQNIWNSNYQNTILPNQFVQGLQGFSGIAGSNTQSSGSSQGTGNSTTTNQPSLWDQGKNILSGGAALAGLFSDGGTVKGRAEGGSVEGSMTPFHHSDDMVTKVGKAFGALHKMRRMAEGGGVDDKDAEKEAAGKQAYDEAMAQAHKLWPPATIPPPVARPMTPRHFDFGGDVGLGSWDATVSGPSFGDQVSNFGKDMGSVSKAMGSDEKQPSSSGGDNANMLAGSQQALASFLNGVTQANRRGFDDGGSVDDPSWGSRFMRGIEGFLPSSVGRGMEAIQGPIVRGLHDYPEAVGEGLGYASGIGSVIPGFSVPVNAVRALNSIGEMAPAPRHTEKYGPPTPSVAPVDGEGADMFDGAAPIPMTPMDSFYGAPASNEATANNESSSIASAREVLPWKLGAGDRPPPSAPPATSPSTWDTIKSYLPNAPMSQGIWAGDQLTPWQRRMAALTQVGDFKGVGDFMTGQQDQRLREAENTRSQELQPSRVQLLAAQAKEASQNADLDYQIKAADAMGDVKRSQELKRMKSMMQLANETGVNPAQAFSTGPPPIEGAKQASDGNWYLPDPDRPGKYLMVQP